MKANKMVVVACMIFHKFILEHDSGDSNFACFGRDPHFIPTIPERYKRYAIISDGNTLEANVVTMDVFRDELTIVIALAWN